MELRNTYSLDDILLVPRYSKLRSREQADITVLASDEYLYDMPIVMSPMDTVTTIPMIKLFIKSNLMPTLHRYFKRAKDQYDFVKCLGDGDLQEIYFAVGSIQTSKDWIDYLLHKDIDKFCVDMAHGDSMQCVDTVEYIKKKSEFSSVMAGNVVTKSGFGRLQDAGADLIRCGVGSGSICSSRIQCAIGLPQFTAIADCASRKSTARLIADGGIKNSGDICKAMAAGADFVMCGKLLAATDLAGGEAFDRHKETCGDKMEICKYKSYHGMASRKAREGVLKHASIEGVSGLIKYAGKTEDLLLNIEMNLKASLSYNGAYDWNEFKQNVKIVRISTSSIIESGTHLDEYD